MRNINKQKSISNFPMSTGSISLIILLGKYKPYFPKCFGHPSAVQGGQLIICCFLLENEKLLNWLLGFWIHWTVNHMKTVINIFFPFFFFTWQRRKLHNENHPSTFAVRQNFWHPVVRFFDGRVSACFSKFLPCCQQTKKMIKPLQ